jgi:hypothetical protein
MLAGIFAAAAPVRAQISPVALSVNVLSSTEREVGRTPKRGGVIPKVEVTQEKQLEIIVANRSRQELSGVVARYYVFVTDIESKETSLLRTGSRELRVPPLATSRLTSEPVTLKYTRRYQKKQRGQVVTIPATGEKFAGYGVQVYFGDQLLAEKFEPPELKAKVGTDWVEEEAPVRRSRKPKD